MNTSICVTTACVGLNNVSKTININDTKQEKEAANGRVSSISLASAPATGSDLPDYLAKEVLKLITRSAAELEAILSEVSCYHAPAAAVVLLLLQLFFSLVTVFCDRTCRGVNAQSSRTGSVESDDSTSPTTAVFASSHLLTREAGKLQHRLPRSSYYCCVAVPFAVPAVRCGAVLCR